MSELYGSWISKNNDFSKTIEKIKGVHEEYYPFYKRRLDSIQAMAELFVEDCEIFNPSLRGKIGINYANIIAGIGRYINDIMHYKLWHDVEVAHRAKMISHTIKWLTAHPAVSLILTKDEYSNLSSEQKYYSLELNGLFVACVVGYFLEHFHSGEAPPFEKYKKIFYLTDTGQFDAKTAALLFEAIL